MDLHSCFEEHLADSRLLEGAGGIAVAFSGGGDSTALLLLLARHASETGLTLTAIHVAHGLRGAAGEADADFCEAFCLEREIGFTLLRVDVPSQRSPSESPEAAARRLRYAALGEEASRRGGALVATGHTLDDQAETVLLNLSRHAGRTRGGIRARRPDGVVRPLLPFRRAALHAWLDAAGVCYRQDETNSEIRFARNRIRCELLPGLETRFPGVTLRLARAGDSLAERLSALDSALDQRLATSGLAVEGPWPRSLFRDLFPEAAARLLVRALGSGGRVPGGVQLLEALASLRGTRESFRASLGGRRLLADGRAVRLLPS